MILTACNDRSTPTPKDSTPPTVSLSRGESDTGALTVAATVNDNVSVTKVEFYQGVTLLATDTTEPFAYTPNLLATRTGFTAKAYDAAGNVGTSPAFDITTLYQGVWGWTIRTADGATVLDSGSAILYYESGPVGVGVGTVAGGGFENAAGTTSGEVVLGPMGTPGALETGFLKAVPTSGATLVSEYFSGEDTDRMLATVQGKATFSGTGTLDKPGGTFQDILVSLVQSSTEVPVTPTARAAARASAHTLALQATTHAHGAPQRGAATPDTLHSALRTYTTR